MCAPSLTVLEACHSCMLWQRPEHALLYAGLSCMCHESFFEKIGDVCSAAISLQACSTLRIQQP